MKNHKYYYEIFFFNLSGRLRPYRGIMLKYFMLSGRIFNVAFIR